MTLAASQKTREDLAQAQKALADKEAVLINLKLTHAAALSKNKGTHHQELETLRTTLKSLIANRDQNITKLSSDNKALNDKLTQIINQGDEKVDSDFSL